MLTKIERISLLMGSMLLLVGIILAVTKKPSDMSSNDVKQQQVPMTLDDFKGDPAVYDAIQKMLGSPERSAPTPQAQSEQPTHDAGNALQPTATGLQAREKP